MFCGVFMFSACSLQNKVCAGTAPRAIDLTVESPSHADLSGISTLVLVPLDPPADSLIGPVLTTASEISPLGFTSRRPGTYRLRIRATGYQEWVRTVTASPGAECGPGVTPVVVVATLMPM